MLRQILKSRIWLALIFRTRLAEKQEEEELRQLQSIRRFTQMQKEDACVVPYQKLWICLITQITLLHNH